MNSLRCLLNQKAVAPGEQIRGQCIFLARALANVVDDRLASAGSAPVADDACTEQLAIDHAGENIAWLPILLVAG